ncbi:hypothetical protein LguiB_020413 [Lonicera macranthoides]
MKLKISLPRIVVNHVRERFHKQNEQIRSDRVSLPQPFCSFKVAIQATIKTDRVRSSHTLHNPSNHQTRKVHGLQNIFQETPLNRVISFLNINLHGTPKNTIPCMIPSHQSLHK